jgi:hypothetical protein
VIPGVRVTVVSYAADVIAAALRASRDAVRHGAAKVRQIARASISPASGPSAPGHPPHTRRGQLPRSILFAADMTGEEAVAFVGPSAALMGPAARAHEFGGQFRGEHYPARPFMGPALDRSLDTFAGDFSGSLSD